MAAPSLLELFRALSAFQPKSADLAEAPWEPFVDWAIVQGLAPLAAYNLEYRMAGAGAPEWARDRLLSVYQGSLNDNVMKLVNFKRSVGELAGRKLLLLGAATFAESLYPHVAFRPVAEIELLMRAADIEGFTHFLRGSEFLPEAQGAPHPSGARAVLTDGRTQLFLYAQLLGEKRRREEDEIFERATPMGIYGPSLYRPSLEDALLLQCIQLARSGFEVPAISFVDARELFIGAPAMGGAYSRPPDVAAVRARAKAWRIERALYAAARIVEELFPEVSKAADSLKPELGRGSRRLLEKWVVEPSVRVGQMRTTRGGERLKRLLSGARF
jgi:hypothetical protein